MLPYGKIARLLLIAAAPVVAQTSQNVPAVLQPHVIPGTPTLAPNRYAIPAKQPQNAPNSPAGNITAIQTQTTAVPQAAMNPMSAAIPQPLPTGLGMMPSASIAHNGTTAVNYLQGKLSILAENAPLGSVLKLVAAKTGANVDLAPELQSEPVMANLGPGSVQEVLTRLLDSPRIDYIIMGSGEEPGSLQRVIVRQRRAFGQTAMQTQPKPQEELDENGHLASSGLAPEDAHLSQAELMDKWRREREEKRVAEIEEQRLAREAERTNPDPPPPPPQDNPPAAPEPPPQNPQ